MNTFFKTNIQGRRKSKEQSKPYNFQKLTE